MTELEQLMYDITGHAMRIHSRLGNDDLEKVYCSELFRSLGKARLKVEQHPRLTVWSASGRSRRSLYPDLRVCRATCRVLVEIKAIDQEFEQQDFRQARRYLNASPLDQAILLLNFGAWPKIGQYRMYPGKESRL